MDKINVYDFDEVIDREDTYCVKYDLVEKVFHQKNIIPLWVADMDFRTPGVVTDELQKLIEHGIYSYTFSPDKYYKAFINWCKNRHGWKVKKDQLLDVHGLIPGLNLSISALTRAGDKIIIQPPVYHPFRKAIQNNNRIVVENNLTNSKGKFEMDFDLLEKQAKESVMIILCSPHNPVARVWTQEELLRVADICLSNDIIIVSDDIHADIIFSGNKHFPIASLSKEISNRCITLMAPGKTFNLQGLQSAFAITSNKTFMEKMQLERDKQGFMLNNLFSMVSCMTAYEKGEDWLIALLAYLQDNRDFVIQYFQKYIPQIKPIIPEGTYIMWLDCTALRMTHIELKNRLTHNAKVALIDGTIFDKSSEKFFRINFAATRTILESALQRIRNSELK